MLEDAAHLDNGGVFAVRSVWFIYSLGHLAPVSLLRQSGGKRPQSGKGSQQKKLSQQLYEGVLVLGGMQSTWTSMDIFLFVRFSTKVTSCFAAKSYFFSSPQSHHQQLQHVCHRSPVVLSLQG